MKKNETVDFSKIRASLLPNAGIDDYFLCIYPDVPDRCTQGIVGFVGNESNPKIKIKLEIDNEWMAEHNYASIAFWTNIDDFADSRIVMTPRYFHEFRRTPCLKFELWHEIGHYHTLHYFNTAFDENGSANKTRMEYFERGDVMPDEKVADLFALYYTSKEDAIQSLSESIRRRRMYTWELPEITNMAIEEFRRRKRLLRDLDSDEKVRDALCQLCGKDNYLEI